MPLSITNLTGDGINETKIATAVMLPDSGSTVNVEGFVQAVNLPAQSFSTTVAAPAVPGSGSVFWNIQVDVTSGAVTAQQSTVSDPAPINGNNVVIFRQTLTFGTSGASLALDPSSTPDLY